MKFKPKGTYLYICRDEPSEEAVESSHDKVIMQKFYERKNPGSDILKKLGKSAPNSIY